MRICAAHVRVGCLSRQTSTTSHRECELSLVAVADEIVAISGDYRDEDGVVFDRAHVLRWIAQFPIEVRSVVLSQVCHILSKTYFSRSRTLKVLDRLCVHKAFSGNDPMRFWAGSNLLNIQTRGASQREMVALLRERLTMAFGSTFVTTSHLSERHIYLDDGLFSGSRVQGDLGAWVAKSSLDRLDLRCFFLSGHTLGNYMVNSSVAREAKRVQKRVTISIMNVRTFENRKANRNSSDVLWPTQLPDDVSVNAYLLRGSRFPFLPRAPSAPNVNSPFSDEISRSLLEAEFTKVGCRLVVGCQNPIDAMRPLGFSNFGIGFGAVAVTYRNCPNNAPLALWWTGGFGGYGSVDWHPLFPRRGN